MTRLVAVETAPKRDELIGHFAIDELVVRPLLPATTVALCRYRLQRFSRLCSLMALISRLAFHLHAQQTLLAPLLGKLLSRACLIVCSTVHAVVSAASKSSNISGRG